jgi:hypothetical protein
MIVQQLEKGTIRLVTELQNFAFWDSQHAI